MTYISLKSVHPFLAQLTVLPNPQNPILYNAFQSAIHPKSALSRGHIYIPMFPGLTRLRTPNCVSIGSAVLAQLTAERPDILQCVLNAIKNINRFTALTWTEYSVLIGFLLFAVFFQYFFFFYCSVRCV